MDPSKQPAFKSTGTITEKELNDLYGPMFPVELVLKFAEHKNFDAARESLKTWNEHEVNQADNMLFHNNRLSPQSHNSWEAYIANMFLKVLIDEYEQHKQEKIRVRMEDPVQQQKAEELLKIRQSGKLPHIDLAGTDFTVDWRLRQMRETEQPWKNISFEDFEMDDYGDSYLCFFNTQTHELYMPPEDLMELPEDIVVLEIPNELKLDPIAVAREYGSDLSELLREYPITEDLSAKVTPLSESGLPTLIENNIKNRGDQQEYELRNPIRGR
ncbi:hypothetical protein GWR56_10065 [Mucilaginibacter sp. 14171R-50]|uniref:hypothetical protein n=1 Tax=Mucilaginibacter sp. 14171R-50 TaxID=2703789 RepID=UPI00138C4E36|nr:hypothetical protein [Mucilaginibacter sp. 14171R-50]QHS55859.1 hypothetical protein GWR56_10065 [Mucilaginibacter sp. 14171R-50]